MPSVKESCPDIPGLQAEVWALGYLIGFNSAKKGRDTCDLLRAFDCSYLEYHQCYT